MALIHCDFFAQSLGMCLSMDVILPQPSRGQIGLDGNAAPEPPAVLYLLHGLSDDHTIWQRRTSIERYVAPLNLAVVMPNVHRSFYSDMESGYRYWTFVSEELPTLVQRFFRVSDRREDTFAAGLSMGGYGAFKLGLRCPERFAAVASLSGVLDLATRADTEESHGPDLRLIFGSQPVRGTADDLCHLARQLVAGGGPRPALYACCGTEDFLYGENLKFRALAREIGLDLTYEEGPGTHEWGYWDRMIQNVLAWLPLRPAAAQ